MKAIKEKRIISKYGFKLAVLFAIFLLSFLLSVRLGSVFLSTKQFGQWFYATRTVMAKDFSGGEGVIALPHSGRSNMVFADGHAASLDANELNELGWLKSRRWIPEAKIRK